ncbi:methyltransferase domain-containing protein [Agromyces protaetiae]|uniref:Methyltransferase domain-containing protein n=1 Tax=Agromyces protaetiae TaxID=2509455 RepID=A0A4P6FEE0_9MICO|nr:methyltransferase [Agromyces protaetiae]QAY73373.1 methyltransferase domain-containing protein [Agromyces protaetiae]
MTETRDPRELLPARWREDEPDASTATLVERLRTDLAAADYTVEGVEALWNRLAGEAGSHPGAALRRGHRVPALRALDAAAGEDSALATLVRAFLLGVPQTRAALDAALPALRAGGAEELGLVASDPASMSVALAPIVDLRPYAFADAAGEGHWWIASDPGELAMGGPLPEDHVLGVGGASTTLSGLLLQRPSRRTLDLGTGSGIQALHASRWSERVVATDVSARALAFARFTARLNGIDTIEFRLGSLYEPVAGERFDRIVSNPPFVITPRADGVPSYEYRDGGQVGDALVEAVLRGAAEHLEPGGIAQFLGNWELRDVPAGGPGVDAGDQTGLERVAGWLDDAGLEYWVVERETLDPSEYAETWIRDGGTRPGTPAFEALHAAWLDDFRARGVAGVGFGYVLLRKPADGGGAPRLRIAERVHGAAGENPGGLGAHFEAVLEASDLVDALSDDDLRALELETAPDVTEERHHLPGAEQPTAILIRQGGGFGRAIDAGTALTALVGASDGTIAVGVLSDAIADLLEVDAAALWAELAPQIRGLVHGGLLRPMSG